MLSKLLDKLGNWNPQLYREIQGRLTVRNVAIATFFSLLAQGFLILFFWTQFPTIGAQIGGYNRYCIKQVPVELGMQCQAIAWNLWWHDIFRCLSWGFLIILLLVGIYMLVADIAKEKRLGTLNFISLSPQSSQKILLGKLLGVPILLYLVIAIALPLHLWSAYQANLSFNLVLIWYGILIAISCLFYNASLAFGFLGGTHGWLASCFGAFFFLPNLEFILLITEKVDVSIDKLKWFAFPELGDAVLVAYGLLLYRCLLRSYLFWQIANRSFRNPQATILSKKQSYFWIAECQIFIFGFCWHLLNTTSKYDFKAGLYFICSLNLIVFLLLIASLSPHRQTLQEWARYRHQQTNSSKGLIHDIHDLIWGEKSPALLAIAINAGIVAAIWLPWVFLSKQKFGVKEEMAIALIMTLTMVLIYGAIAQITLLKKAKKLAIWVVIYLTYPIFFLPIAISTSPFLTLFLPVPFFAVGNISPTTIFLAFLCHLGIIGLLSWQLTRKLKKFGESTSKSLIIS